MFGGSEGGLSGVVIEAAALLAARGYPALALAYFHEPGLPPTLTTFRWSTSPGRCGCCGPAGSGP